MLRAILFDFDGVIGDSNSITASYIQKTLRHFGYPSPRKIEFEQYWGMKSIDILHRLLPDISKERMQEIFAYVTNMSLQHASKIPLFPGAKEVLQELSKKYKLALITSRGKKTLQIIFEKYALHEHFLTVFDQDDLTNHKPHPEGILKALEFLGVTKKDVLASQNAGIACVIVGKANPHRAEYHITTISQLPKLIASL